MPQDFALAAAFVARHVVFLALLGLAAWACGWALAGRHGGAGGGRMVGAKTPGTEAGRYGGGGLAFAGGLERAVVAAALGLAALGHLAFFLGLVGWLAPGPLLAGCALLLLPGLPRAMRWWRGRRERRDERELSAARFRRAVLWTGVAVLVAAPCFALALYPPTAFDATTYHLPMAKAFAASGELPFLPALRAPVFPPLAELLAAVALLFAGDTATHLVQLLAAGLTAGLLLAWGSAGGDRRAGYLAAAIFLGNPIAVHLATSGYVDMTLTLFGAGTLLAIDRWRDSRHAGWLAAAGFFAGSAAAVKYLGLFFVAAVVVAAFGLAGRGRRTRAAALAAACALAALLPAYARLVAHTGNPLFPYLPQVFGESQWTWHPEDMPAVHRGFEAPPAELARRWARLPLLPWDLVFARERTNHQPPFSPVYLLALPLLALGAVRERRVRRLLAPAGAYLALFPLLPPDARYLVPVLPPLSLAVAASLVSLLDRLRAPALTAGRRRRLAAAVAAGCLLPGWFYAGWRLHRQGPPPPTAAARERYLAAALPAYPALRHLDRSRGGGYTVYALHAENLAYFARGRFLGEWSGPAAFAEVSPFLGDPAALHAKLRSLGADHLLLVRGKDYGLPGNPAFRRLFREVYADSRARVFALGSSSGAARPGRSTPRRGASAASSRGPLPAAGKAAEKTVRSPGALSTATRPPWALTMRSTIARPRPVPPLRVE
jgi:4-amino-4-deoxy-L-arabinose transferase-like glycosyltransferase